MRSTDVSASVSLPQHAPDRQRRRARLESQRRRYRYATPSHNPLAPIAVAHDVPLAANYNLGWALPYLPQLFRSLAGAGWGRLRQVATSARDKAAALRAPFRGAGLPLPSVVGEHEQDGAFARNWLDGTNPLTIERVRDRAHLERLLPIEDAQLRAALGGPRSLDDELREGRLYVADYQLLHESLAQSDWVGRDSRWREKYLPAPVVLLCDRPGLEPLCDLVPVAIQLERREARGPNPLYLRGAGNGWRLAKLYVAVADFNLQALSSHIQRHHYVAEPFAVSTRRQLAEEHPLYVLLEPHLAMTMAVNHAAFGLLKTPGSVFDQIYAGELPETRQILIRSHERWSLADQALETDLATRGVGEQPRDYPWRDDARLWRPAIERYVAGYLRLFYPSDAALGDDDELAAWLDELRDSDGGNLRGLLPSGGLTQVDELIALVAQLLFIAGPGHAAVHFPQTDYFTYAPAHPAAAYRPPPREGEPITEERLRETLPPVDRGVAQFLNNQIAYYRYDRFGDFGGYRLGRMRAARGVIAQLGKGLDGIERTIEARNQKRPRPYRYLLPSLVPNSINI
jgi:arachidonate 15-lipoxygenase